MRLYLVIYENDCPSRCQSGFFRVLHPYLISEWGGYVIILFARSHTKLWWVPSLLRHCDDGCMCKVDSAIGGAFLLYTNGRMRDWNWQKLYLYIRIVVVLRCKLSHIRTAEALPALGLPKSTVDDSQCSFSWVSDRSGFKSWVSTKRKVFSWELLSVERILTNLIFCETLHCNTQWQYTG